MTFHAPPPSWWALVFALVTTLANATALALQHVANTRAPRTIHGWRLWRHLLIQPLWLLGWATLGLSLAGQALALHFGPLSEVQPLLVCELVFALVLRRFAQHRGPATYERLGTALTVGGLVLFLVVALPRSGTTGPGPTQWAVGITAVAVSVVTLTITARRGSQRKRAVAYGAATGLLWALEATFIKSATDVMTRLGVLALVTHWPLFAVVVTGLAGLVCEQRALHAGPLRYSQPLIVIVDPLASVVLGLGLFHERMSGGLVVVILSFTGLVGMSWGVVTLTRSSDIDFVIPSP